MYAELQPGHRKEGEWIFALIEDILHPKDGYRCIGPAWWVVTPSNEVIFFKSYNFPQCTYTKSIADFLVKRSVSPLSSESRLIEMAFIPNITYSI